MHDRSDNEAEEDVTAGVREEGYDNLESIQNISICQLRCEIRRPVSMRLTPLPAISGLGS